MLEDITTCQLAMSFDNPKKNNKSLAAKTRTFERMSVQTATSACCYTCFGFILRTPSPIDLPVSSTSKTMVISLERSSLVDTFFNAARISVRKPLRMGFGADEVAGEPGRTEARTKIRPSFVNCAKFNEWCSSLQFWIHNLFGRRTLGPVYVTSSATSVLLKISERSGEVLQACFCLRGKAICRSVLAVQNSLLQNASCPLLIFVLVSAALLDLRKCSCGISCKATRVNFHPTPYRMNRIATPLLTSTSSRYRRATDWAIAP